MALISVQNLTFGYDGAEENIFENASFQIDTEWHLGLIGRNGRGKTTFLRLLLGMYEYRGTISAPMDFDYFPFAVDDPMQLCSELTDTLCPDCPQWKLLREMGLLELSADVLYRPFDTLSNGEQTKLLLCFLFLRENRFLLIDEPTNHLDLHGREILSRYLRSKQGFLLVSHDQFFLDGCIDHVLSINRATIEVQKGNCTTWLKAKQERDEFELTQNRRLKKEIFRLEQSAREKADWADRSERQKIGFDPTKTEKSMGRRPYLAAKSKKVNQRASAIAKRQAAVIEEKQGLLKDIEKQDSLLLPCQPYRSERLGELREVTGGYDGEPVFAPVSFEIRQGDRILLSGANGSGKSTLLKLMAGEASPLSGTIRLGSGLTVSYLPQSTDGMCGSLEEYAAQNKLDYTAFLTFLRKLDFPRRQFTKRIEQFSAGQKKKVLLAKSLCEPANLYIWDEPLNYIDIISRRQVEDLILASNPTILFVEHDRAFCEKIATKVIELKK